MKKFLTMLLALSLSASALSLAACGGDGESGSSSVPASESVGESASESTSESAGEKQTVYTVTATEWTAALSVVGSTNFQVDSIAKDPEGTMKQTSTLKQEGAKQYMSLYQNDVWRQEQIYDTSADPAVIYDKASENGNYVRRAPETYEPMTFELNFEGVLKIVEFAKADFAKAVYDETTKNYTLTYATASFAELELDEVVDMKYVVAFEDGAMSDLKIEFVAKDSRGDMHAAYENFIFGGVTVALPEIKDAADMTVTDWAALAADENFHNFRLVITGSAVSGIVVDSTVPILDYKIDGNSAYGIMGGEDEGFLDAQTLEALRNVYVKTALAMLENFEDFEYDATLKAFKSKNAITYNVTVLGQRAKIVANNVVVEITEDLKLGKITCNMKQYLLDEQDAESFLCEINVAFAYSEYGTVVLPNSAPLPSLPSN